MKLTDKLLIAGILILFFAPCFFPSNNGANANGER